MAKKRKRTKRMGPSLEEILAGNPQLDPESVYRLIEFRKKFRARGEKSRYGLASPSTFKRVSADLLDRTIRLGQRALA